MRRRIRHRRRWNRRQGTRTRITEVSVNAVFLLEGLVPAAPAGLGAAATELAEYVEKTSPGVRITLHGPE
ncbi:hypothetical protein SATRM34S_06409 [Streptomyces atroolivaceus]